MPFVVDASLAICWLMPDEHESAADDILARLESGSAVVPSIFWFEVRNALLVNERRSRLSFAETNDALNLLATLPLQTDDLLDEGALTGLARRHRLTVYDATYLELAKRRSIGLATFDMSWAKAARAEDLAVLGPQSAL